MRSLAALFALSMTTFALAAADKPVAPKGFDLLFNGEDLTHWQGWAIHDKGSNPIEMAKLPEAERAKKFAAWTADAKKHWSVKDHELINDGKGAYLATVDQLGDVELRLEYKTVAKADSGIYLRGAPQVQIWDTTEEAKFSLGANKGSGGLWNNSPGAPGKDPLVKADKPFGEWNQVRILQVGEYVTVYLNDKLVVDHARLENYYDRKQPLLAKGSVLLQTHGGEIRFKNVFVRPIPAAEANAMLSAKAGGGFTPIFDGKTLTGWTGATKDYEVVDGAIVCKPKHGGNLYTAAEYADFSAKLEYQLPPGGNNGLAIRYPGTGDAAYSGMCEVQILDDTAKMYEKLDARQYNGSVYGMIPAARGYLRPVGEWNFMRVTVKGPKIVVELNGSRIVDGDVSAVKDVMGGTPHPGKDLPKGHFGFAGHSDPVKFRAVEVRAEK